MLISALVISGIFWFLLVWFITFLGDRHVQELQQVQPAPLLALPLVLGMQTGDTARPESGFLRTPKMECLCAYTIIYYPSRQRRVQIQTHTCSRRARLFRKVTSC